MDSAIVLGLVPMVFMLAMAAGIKYICGNAGNRGKRQQPWLVWAAMAVMLAVRLLLAGSMEGYACDVQTFQAWAVRAAEDFGGFYSGKFFADYPPGYMYVLFLIGKLKALLLLPDRCTAFLALIKLPAIAADLATVLLVYRLATRHVGSRSAFALALMYGLNPAVILNSSVWGQVDAIFTLFIVLAIYCLTEDRLAWSVSIFAAALLIKPQALIFTPLLLAAAMDRLLISSDNRIWRRLFVAATAGATVFIAGIAPFAFVEGPLWIFRHYRDTLTSYPFATVNAYNLFALSGANFVPETSSWLVFSYRNWGTFFIVLATLFALRIYFCGQQKDRLYLMGAFLIAAVFIFASRMHERYLFPVLAFALLAALYARSREMLIAYTGFSITHYLNVAHVLLASTVDVYHIPTFNPLLLGTSGANLLLFCYLVYHIARTWSRQGVPVPADDR